MKMAKEYIDLEAVCYQLKIQESFDGQPRAIRRARRIVANFPSADVVPVRHGRWTRIDYEPLGHDYICSECAGKNDRASQYCPDCGARMDLRKCE